MHRVGWGLALSAALIVAAVFVSKPQGNTVHPLSGGQTAAAAYFYDDEEFNHDPSGAGSGSMSSYAYPASDGNDSTIQIDGPAYAPQVDTYQGYYQQSPDDSGSGPQYTPSYYDTDLYGSGTGGGSDVTAYYDTGSPYTTYAAPSYGSGGGNTAPPYYDEIVYQPLTTQKPWYEKLLPGVGTSLASLLPPLMRQDPSPTAAPVPIAPQPSPVRPTCIISANPGVIARGQRANLAWGSQNAVRAQLSSGGLVAVRGGTSISPAQSTVYVLTVYGQSGLAGSCSAAITVH